MTIIEKVGNGKEDKTKTSEHGREGSSLSVIIPPPNIQLAEYQVVGTAPLIWGNHPSPCVNGPQRDFTQNTVIEMATLQSREGWCGVPSASFRGAMISATRLLGINMTRAKMSIFLEGDGVTCDEGLSLVRVEGAQGKHRSTVRFVEKNETFTYERAIWRKWECVLRIRYDEDQFSLHDVTNLLFRAGHQVGIGIGRPDYGLFTIQ